MEQVACDFIGRRRKNIPKKNEKIIWIFLVIFPSFEANQNGNKFRSKI